MTSHEPAGGEYLANTPTAPNLDELWQIVHQQRAVVRDQQARIERLRSNRSLGRGIHRPLTAVVCVAAFLALTGITYAASPIKSNLIHGCYGKKSRAVTVTTKSCPSGTLALPWDQYTRIRAASPLGAKRGANGAAPTLSLGGTVPVARGGTGNATGKATGFTGPLSGDVTGTQLHTSVSSLAGTPLSSSAPQANQLLGFDGTSWTPTSVYDPLQVATLRWYGANEAGETVTVGTNPSGLAFDGGQLWVTNLGSGTVSEIDVATDSVVNTITVGMSPGGAAFDGSHIWVSNYGSNNVSEIDIGTHSVINTVTVGSGPVGEAFDGSHIWVANTGSNNVSEIDVATHTVINTVSVGTYPYAIAFGGSHIWVANTIGNDVSEIDVASHSVVHTVTVGTYPEGLAFDGSHIWVGNDQSSSVGEIDVASATVIKTVNVGTNPVGVAFDGSHIWVANAGSNNVTEIDVATQRPVATVPVGTDPQGLAFDGSRMWVPNYLDGTVSIL